MRISDWSSDVCSSDLVHHLLLVLEQQPVELVGQQVDRRVHVDGAGVGMEDLAGEVDRGLGAVVGLVEAELGADLEGLLEMPRQALELALDIVAQGRCHLDLMAVDIDTHSPPTGFSGSSEEYTSELQSLMRISFSVFCFE